MNKEMSKKVFITRRIPQAGIDLLLQHGFEVDTWPEDRPVPMDVMMASAQSSNVLLCLSTDAIGPGFLWACPNLELISQFAAGYDNIDIKVATALGITVTNTPGAMSNATADVAFGLMIAVARNMFMMHKKIERGDWGYFRPLANLGVELKGKTLGIFGLGTIGIELAKRCKGAYDMDVVYCNRTRNEMAERMTGARWVSFEEMLRVSDVVSVHCALTDATRGIFNSTAFDMMKPSAIFINTSRGGVHDEADLVEALQQGKIWGAGLDVTNPEPMDPENPLLQMDHVCVLPHIGSATIEARTAMSVMAAENIIEFYTTGKCTHAVNRPGTS